MRKEKYVIQKIIEEISELAGVKGRWAITLQRIMDITGIQPHKFRSYVYKTKRKINMPDTVLHFNNENPEDLITLLETIYGDNIENDFAESGVFIPYSQRIELNSFLLNHISMVISNHTLNEEDLEAMLYGTDSFIEARDIYYEEEFDINKMIKNAGKNYLSSKYYKIPKLGEDNVYKYLYSLFERNIFIKENLFYSLEMRIKDFAVRKNLFKGQFNENDYKRYYKTKSRNKTSSKTTIEKGAKEKAKEIMGIRGRIDTTTLKKQYKDLMKKYHPDLNPNGLQKSQEINQAYSLLMSEVST